MPLSVEDIARRTQAALATDASLILCGTWVAERYQRLCSRTRFRHLRQVAELVLPAPITAGTITVTQDSSVVVGDATAQAAWTADVIGRHLRLGQSWYEIVGRTPVPDLQLRVGVMETSATGLAYRIAPRWTTLPVAARWLGSFVHLRRGTPIEPSSAAELDFADPGRTRVAGGPNVYAEVGRADDGRKRLEFYPGWDQRELIAFVYWPHPSLLRFTDPLPPEIDADVLRDGALIDLMRYEASRAARAGNVEQAAYWRNESRAQATSWEGAVLEAIRADQGGDDVSLIYQLAGRRGRPPRDIITGRDLVYDRWPI